MPRGGEEDYWPTPPVYMPILKVTNMPLKIRKISNLYPPLKISVDCIILYRSWQ